MSDTAHHIWSVMRALVLDHERRKEVCDALDMSFVRVKALLALQAEPMTMGNLAAHLATDAPYTTLIVDDLERRGMLIRTIHPNDRRAKIVTLTASGHDTANRATQILGEPPETLRQLPATQLSTLADILAQLEPDALTPPGSAELSAGSP
jgi:DNA-binding MarR family transcriptional regulator